MKPHRVKLTLDTPCSMNWDSLIAVEAEKRFCGSCNKVVTDFTSMPDEELIRFFLRNKNVCGRLTSDQLHKTFDEVARKKSKFRLSKLLLLPSFLLSIPGFAQQVKEKTEPEKVVSVKSTKIPVTTTGRLITISGTVCNDTLAPVRTVVTITNGRDSVSEFSGGDGKYSIAISCFDSDSIIISASETWSEDFSKTIQSLADTIAVDIVLVERIIPPQQIHELHYLGGISASMVYAPMSPVRHFFFRITHPFRKFRGWLE